MNRYYSRSYLVGLALFVAGELAMIFVIAQPIAQQKGLQALLAMVLNCAFLLVGRMLLRLHQNRLWETDNASWIRARRVNGDLLIKSDEVTRVDRERRDFTVISDHGAMKITRDCQGYTALRTLIERWEAESGMASTPFFGHVF